MLKRLAKPLAMQFAKRCRAIADAQERWGYEPRLTVDERKERLTLAWAMRLVAQAVDEVYET